MRTLAFSIFQYVLHANWLCKLFVKSCGSSYRRRHDDVLVSEGPGLQSTSWRQRFSDTFCLSVENFAWFFILWKDSHAFKWKLNFGFDWVVPVLWFINEIGIQNSIKVKTKLNHVNRNSFFKQRGLPGTLHYTIHVDDRFCCFVCVYYKVFVS